MLRLICLVALLALALPTARAQDAIDTLTDALELTDAQVEIVEDVYRPDDPGVGWALAAALGPTLVDTQRARLLMPPAQRTRLEDRGDGRGRRGARGGRRERSPTDRTLTRAARDAALGLDAEQSAALDLAWEAGRAEPGADPVTPAVAELLDAQQQALVRMQRAMTRILLSAQRAGRRGGPRG